MASRGKGEKILSCESKDKGCKQSQIPKCEFHSNLTVLNSGGESGHPYLVLNLSGNASNISPFSKMQL